MESPEGKYGFKIKGRPMDARTVHYFTDCRHLQPITDDNDTVVSEVVILSDEIIDLMGLAPCRKCKSRAERVEPEEVISPADVQKLRDAGFEIIRTRQRRM